MTSVHTMAMPRSSSPPSRAVHKEKRVRFSFKSKKKQKLQRVEEESSRAVLISSIKATEVQLKKAYISFNEVTDQDLVDCCIFEINALHARHNYLTKQLKGIS